MGVVEGGGNQTVQGKSPLERATPLLALVMYTGNTADSVGGVEGMHAGTHWGILPPRWLAIHQDSQVDMTWAQHRVREPWATAMTVVKTNS